MKKNKIINMAMAVALRIGKLLILAMALGFVAMLTLTYLVANNTNKKVKEQKPTPKIITYKSETNDKEMLYRSLDKRTVEVTTEEKNRGGSGVILQSGPRGSIIVTNAHVCRGVAKNGIVFNHDGEYKIRAYKIHPNEDVCMAFVRENLKVNTKLANFEPRYLDTAYVSGHPLLNPLTITEGHFSDYLVIKVMTSNFEVKQVFARYVTSLAAPGSSGSGVYNSKGELSGLLFAGSGRAVSMSFIVPLTTLKFALFQLDKQTWKTPSSVEEEAFVTPKVKKIISILPFK